MKRSIIALLLAVIMISLPVLTMAEEVNVINWFNESDYWMTVANGHWSKDAADQITDEQLAAAFSVATKQQNAVHWTPWYFVVVKDFEEQKKIIGDYWAAPEECVTEGTVTILCLADQLLTAEQGHASEYNGYYMPTNFAYYDSGMTCGLLEVGLAAQGYYTHYFGTITGEYAPHDVANGAYQSMSRYLSEDDVRAWGFRSAYGSDASEAVTYPVLGNCVFVCAIVVGKPAADETIETWGTNHSRPQNWKIWDGTVNDTWTPAPVAAPAEEAAEETVEEEVIEVELAENEYLGTAKGMEGDVVVKVTIVDGAITAVEVIAQGESAPSTALTDIPAAIVAANSAEVDAVAGATVTSNAIMAAVADAIAQAQ